MGVFTSGGTIANITGLWVARNRTLPRVDELGLFESFKLLNKTKMVVIGSEVYVYVFCLELTKSINPAASLFHG